MAKKLLRVTAMLLVMALLLCACGTKDKNFSSNGLTMQLPGNYKPLSSEDSAGYTFAMGSNKSIIMGLKEEKSVFEAYGVSLTLEDYTDLVILNNGIDVTVTYDSGIPTFTFISNVDGTNFKYVAATFEGTDAFWLLQFACEESNFDSMYERFIQYLTTVTV